LSKKVAILGCGWLGLPLAKALLNAGYLVHGSTTSEEKLAGIASEGIQAFQIRLEEGRSEGHLAGFLKGVELLIINIPPGIRRDGEENYVRKMETVSQAVKEAGVPKLLFVSSTSVYGDSTGLVTEATSPAPKTESGRQVLAAEQLFQADPELQTIIVRFGGLIGPGRHPVTLLAGKKGLPNGDDPVNLIHLNDCIHLIKTVVEGEHWNQVFNGVYPAHPKKREYYAREALKRQLAIPEYEPSDLGINGKYIISKNYLTNSYSFFTSIFF
jgi:nucleoside-diphosphate-sugar epimerase